METDDLFDNLDWDPLYLSFIFLQDFNDMSDLWNCEVVSDRELLEVSETSHYCPIVEDISMDDSTLCAAVEQIEKE